MSWPLRSSSFVRVSLMVRTAQVISCFAAARCSSVEEEAPNGLNEESKAWPSVYNAYPLLGRARAGDYRHTWYPIVNDTGAAQPLTIALM